MNTGIKLNFIGDDMCLREDGNQTRLCSGNKMCLRENGNQT